MKTIQKTMLAAISATLLFGIPAFAQVGSHAGVRGAHAGNRPGMHRNLIAELNLTPDQKTKIKAIRQAEKAQVMPIRRNASLTPQQKRDQIKPIAKDAARQIMAILTPAQRAQLKELRKEARAQKQNRTTATGTTTPGTVKG